MDDEPEPHQEEPLRLDLWFANPISELLDNRTETSDGGFLVLSGALALYERYLVKKFPGLDASGKNYIERDTKWGGDLGLEQPLFSAFWDCFRNGLQHQFQPKTRCGKTKYEWSLSSHYGVPKVEAVSEKLFRIEINPWSFAALVRKRYSDNQELMNTCDSHKLGEIRPLKESQQIQSISEATPDPPFHLFHPNLSPNPKSPTYQIAQLETGNSSATPKPKPLAEA